MTDPRAAISDVSDADLGAWLAARGEAAYRIKQIRRPATHTAAADWADLTDLPTRLRDALAAAFRWSSVEPVIEQASADGETRKVLLQLHDGHRIETVLMPHHGARNSVCISTQAGCPMACAFCATGEMGLIRNLTAGEIVDQVYRAEQLLAALPADDPTRRSGADHITNLVFMGMGEPLHNYKNLMQALRILTDERGADFSRKRITVSTAGLVPGIEKLAQEELQPNLAISLNASTDEVRDVLMPINKKWPIARLLEAVKKMPLERKRRVTFEYVLLDGVNDSDADAQRLARLLQGIPAKVNLIPWNPHPLAPYKRPADARVRAFQDVLRNRGMAVYVRKSRGDDIDAACGQLAARDAGVVQIRTS